MVRAIFIAVVTLCAGAALSQTKAASRPVDPEILNDFRSWNYGRGPFPSQKIIDELLALPDGTSDGEVLYWKVKSSLRTNAFRATAETITVAKRLIVKAAASGFAPARAEAIYNLICDKGYKSLEDRDFMIAALTNVAKEGVPDAARYLGMIYRDGSGEVEKNLPLAESRFRNAIAFGDNRSWRHLAEAQDQNAEKDAAIASLTRGADAGDPEAAFLLGSWYAQGHLVEKDPEKAVMRFRQAADVGFPPAQLALATYARAIGDNTTARDWAEKAAASGMPEAVAFRDELRRQAQ